MKHLLYICLLVFPMMLSAQDNGGNVHSQEEALKLLAFSSDSGSYLGHRTAIKRAQYIPHIGKQIKIAREKKSISIRQLSKKLSLNESQLLKVEQGRSALTRRMIGKIEQYLDCEIIVDGAG